MNCHVEWIRNFLLRNSTITSNYTLYIKNKNAKISPYGELSALRFQLLKPGFDSFIKHTFYSLTISIIDSNYPYENSNFSFIRSYLLQYLPCVDVSIKELEGKQFSSSHYTLSKSILMYYIRFYLKPSAISPTCYGQDIETYERSLYEWGRSVCKSEIPYLPGNFMIDFGTAQVVSIILSKIHPELIQLSRITFSERLTQNEIIRNWREVGTALNVIGVHVPTEKEWGDNLCLLCFGIDLFKAIYNKTNSSNLVEFQMKQNQINQQINNPGNNYNANHEINKIDFLIGQMNSISNGNPNVFLTEPYQQNPILVQQQRVLQYQQQQQQLLQIQQQQEIQRQQEILQKQLNYNNFNQPEVFNYHHNESNETNIDAFNSRVKIVSTKKREKDFNHFESKKSEFLENRKNVEDDLILQRAKKFKLLKEIKTQEKQKENKKIKKSKENDKNETAPNFKIMSSFAIDPSFPNQCKLTTYKEAIDPRRSKKIQILQMNENQFKQLQKFDKFEQKEERSNKKKKFSESNISTVKCSYVTFEDDNQDNQINSRKNIDTNITKSKRKKNHKHHHDSLIKKKSLFDDVIDADKTDFQNPKNSQDFHDIISKQKDEFIKKSKLNADKSGTDLLSSINSFIEQQREAIAAASLAKKIENSKTRIPEKLPDFSQFDASQPESIKIFDNDPILLINSQSFQKDNKNHQKNAKNSEITSQNELNKSSSSSLSSHSESKERSSKKNTQNNSSFSDPLVELSKNKNDNNHSSSSIKSNSSSGSKRNKKIESEKVDHLNKSTSSSQKIDKSENSVDSELPVNLNNKTDVIINKSESQSSINSQNEIKHKSTSSEILEEEESDIQSSEIKKTDFAQSNKNISDNFSRMKNSSKMDSFLMKSELTFPDIPSLIDPSFRFDQLQNEEKVQPSDQQNQEQNSTQIKNSDQSFNKIKNSEQNTSKLQTSSQIKNSEQNTSKLQTSDKIKNSSQNTSKLQLDKIKNSEQNTSKLQTSSQIKNSEQNTSKLQTSDKIKNSEQNASKLQTSSQNTSKINDSNKVKNQNQSSNELQNSNLISDKEKISSNSHNSNKANLSEHNGIDIQNTEKESIKLNDSEKELNNEQSSNNEKHSNSNKRPIPLPPSPNSLNIANSNSKLPFSFKSNSQKSESLTPAELSLVSGFETESALHKQESESLPNPSNKTLNDDNELSIDQNSSEIKKNASNSNANSDSFGQSTIKKIKVPSSESKQTNSILENSQSSNKVESAVEDFVPEIERFSSGNDQKKKASLSNENDDASIKRFHSSSSSSDSIPFKVLHSDSEKNHQENNKKSEEEINEELEKKEESKPFTSVIEEFDLSSIKPSKRKQIPIQSISGPIILNEEPIPKETQNKGASSETRRVSFSLGIKGFAPHQPNQFSTSANIPRLNKNNTTSITSSLNFNDNDIDTFMSTASLSHSLTIPIEDRLKMYSKDHSDLSLPLSDPEPEIIQEYRDVSTANVGKNYIWLSDDEKALLENILPIIAAKSDIKDIDTFISKELKMPKNNSSVHRIAVNIKTFLISRDKQ